MNKRKRCMAVFMVLIVLLMNIDTFPVHAEQRSVERVVKVACGMNDALYLDELGSPTGLALPILRQIAWNAGWTLQYVEGSYTENLQKLCNGDIDLMFPIGMDDDVDSKLLYSEFSGGIQQIGLFAKDDADIYYEDYKNFDGKKIALSQGGTSESLDTYAKKKGFNYTKEYKYGTVQAKIEALMKGDVDLVAFSTLNSVPGGKLVGVIKQLPEYFCTSKENKEIYNELNAAISMAMINTPDIVSQCYKDMMTGVTKSSFTRQEHEKIESMDEITFGVYSDFLPLCGVNTDGDCVGIYVDTIKEIAKESGLKVKIVPVEDDGRLYQYMDDGTVDFVVSLTDLRFHVENSDKYIITNGIADYTTVAVSLPEYQFDDDDSTCFALTKPRQYLEDYIKLNFPDSTIKYYDTRRDCMKAVESGKADATFMNTWEFNYESMNPRFQNLMEWENIRMDSTFSVASLKTTDLEILSILEKTISQIPDNTIDEIISKNLNMIYDSYTLGDRIYNARTPIIAVGIIIILAVISIWIYLRGVKRRSGEYKRFMGYICSACDSVAEVNLKNRKVTKFVMKDGLVQEEYISDNIEHLFMVDPADKEMVESLFSKDSILEIIRKGEAVNFECRMKWKEEDEYRWNTCILQGIIPSNERTSNFLMIIKDINDIREEEAKQKIALSDALEQAKQASLSKGQFLSRMSHEIRTPLNAVIGYMSMGKEAKNNQEKMIHCIDKSEIAAKHLLNIINDVLDMSSIESGKMKIALRDFDLKGLISEITTVFYQQAKNKGIQFIVNVKEITQEWVVGDSLRVNQILMNLLSNAVKFTPENGTITLNIEQLYKNNDKVYLRFEVSDTGIGMSKEYMRRLFQPFEQETATTAMKYGGSGLGLSITKNLIDMMGGTIKVSSIQNEGTIFVVTLYFDISKRNENDVAKPKDYSHVRVLIVDDVVDEGKYIKNTLKQCNVKSDTVTSGEAALKQLKRRNGTDYAYDMCILDWSMPGLDGIETAKKIREEYGEKLPILIATAYDTTEIETQAAQVGVNSVVSKPLFPSTMFDILVTNFGKYDPDQGTDGQLIDVSGISLILAEDNEMNMEIAVDVLSKAGIKVTQVENGKEAVEEFLNCNPGTYDMILMDVQMPIMNGYTATHEIRESSHPEAKTIPIIAMTANAFAEDVTQALASGMNDHISKPIDKEKLIRVIAGFSKKKRK